MFSLLTSPPRMGPVRGKEPRSVFAWQASSKSAGVAREGNGNQMTFFPLKLVWSHRSKRLRVLPTKFEASVLTACASVEPVAVKLPFIQLNIRGAESLSVPSAVVGETLEDGPDSDLSQLRAELPFWRC